MKCVLLPQESVDTPLVERRKNWFQRQLNRMGSVRSSSTTYSSGLFGRGRHNSVYSSPEAGPPGPPGAPNSVLQHKMSFYDRFVSRKSGRGQHRGASRQGAYSLCSRRRFLAIILPLIRLQLIRIEKWKCCSQLRKKVKLYLCLTNSALRHEDICVSGCIDPRFLDITTSWRWAVSFTPQPLSPRWKSLRYPLDGGLGMPQKRFGRHGEEKILDPTGTRTPTPQSSRP
jgi:hypothetical protein